MEINVRTVDAVTVVELTGELDGKTAPVAQDQILPLAQKGSKIILDMTDLAFMSSAGLRVLLLLYRQISGNQGAIALVGLSQDIRDTMDMTGFLTHFAVYDTADLGVQALSE